LTERNGHLAILTVQITNGHSELLESASLLISIQQTSAFARRRSMTWPHTSYEDYSGAMTQDAMK